MKVWKQVELPLAAVIIGVILTLSFATSCEEAPPPPCRDIKLSPFTTQVCPHADHELETHALKASVCRCK